LHELPKKTPTESSANSLNILRNLESLGIPQIELRIPELLRFNTSMSGVELISSEEVLALYEGDLQHHW